jgi:predicted transcriptional regulator
MNTTTTKVDDHLQDEIDKLITYSNGKPLNTEERIEQLILWIRRTNKNTAKL